VGRAGENTCSLVVHLVSSYVVCVSVTRDGFQERSEGVIMAAWGFGQIDLMI
jgi:hypothetical protein